MSYCEQAENKLKSESNAGKYDTKEKAMKQAVLHAVMEFCRQDEEFAQAVVQGGTFEECMKKVAKGVGDSISDLDAYKKAVTFYFPGAEVRCKMEIDVCPNRVGAERQMTEAPQTVMLDLGDFL